MKKIIFISKIPIRSFPRLIGIPITISSLGYKVTVIAPEAKPYFYDNHEIDYIEIGHKDKGAKSNKLSKLINWIYLRIQIFNQLNKMDKSSTLWLSSADTAIALWGAIFKYDYILQINELYDKIYLYKKLLKRLSKHANKVVVPEINRAYIIKSRYDLEELPFVLPNKPSYAKDMEVIIDNKTESVLNEIEKFANGRKIILYQGIIAYERKFDGIIEFVIENKENYCLVLLGSDNGYLKQVDINVEAIFYAGYLLPPNHLEVTKLAWTCIMSYDTTSLNNIYCAPNKIWEYTKYNKPILSQDLPGIKMLLKEYNIGESCDIMNKDDVDRAIKAIDKNYEDMKNNTKSFYESIDIKQLISQLLQSV